MKNVKLQLSGVNHIYRTAFLVGDAYDIIEKMRKGDAYFNNFYSDDNIVIDGENYDGLLNTPIHLKNKKVKFFNLHLGGGAWIPIFKEISRSSNKGIYIESTAAELCPWNPLYSKKLGNIKLEYEYLSSSEKLIEFHSLYFDEKLKKKDIQEIKVISKKSNKLDIKKLKILNGK